MILTASKVVRANIVTLRKMTETMGYISNRFFNFKKRFEIIYFFFEQQEKERNFHKQ